MPLKENARRSLLKRRSREKDEIPWGEGEGSSRKGEKRRLSCSVEQTKKEEQYVTGRGSEVIKLLRV